VFGYDSWSRELQLPKLTRSFVFRKENQTVKVPSIVPFAPFMVPINIHELPVGGHNETLLIHSLLNNPRIASAAETEIGNSVDRNFLGERFL